MLLNINIRDLAVVESLDLNLEQGMSVLTGETGAGKSILLTALGLALGERADSGYIRPGSKRAEVSLEFDLTDANKAKQWLEDNELDDEQQCIIRRIVNQDGRSKAYINNRPVTLQTLHALSEKLVEIHGQHAHLTLLDPEEQRRLLDEFAAQQQQILDNFANNQPLLNQVNDLYREWHKANKQLTSLKKAGKDQTEREELLRYQLDELQQLDLNQFDYQAISTEHNKLANLDQILSSGQAQLDLLYENDQQSVNQMLAHSHQVLIDLSNLAPELNEINCLLSEAQIQVEEASQQLRRYLESQEPDPQRLNWLENQIGTIQNLSRKHQIKPEQLPELAVQIEQELDNLSHSSEQITQLTDDVAHYFSDYQKHAKLLSDKRRQNALILQKQITDMIKELGMPQGEFIIQVDCHEADSPQLNGTDKIDFLVSANPGLPPKSLAKVASGGELSRISLAIQVTTSNDKTTPTMIFDEVDSGIGGGIAEIVGQKLRSLSNNRQILCVTHLPQVASQAHHHLFVSKNNQSAITSSNVKLLDAKQRIDEVARMLGGVNITENTLAHAREMLNTSTNT